MHVLLIDKRPFEEEVDASSTPVHCGGYFPQFPRYEGIMSPIVLHCSVFQNGFGSILKSTSNWMCYYVPKYIIFWVLFNHAGKNLIDEILDSPTGIAKCMQKTSSVFSNKLKDENKPRKTSQGKQRNESWSQML